MVNSGRQIARGIQMLGLFSLICMAGIFAGCDEIFGSKNDITTDEIFEAGKQEPELISEVEYVPLFPVFFLYRYEVVFPPPIRPIYIH